MEVTYGYVTLKVTIGWYGIKRKVHEHCFNELNSLINEITCKEAPAFVLSS